MNKMANKLQQFKKRGCFIRRLLEEVTDRVIGGLILKIGFWRMFLPWVPKFDYQADPDLGICILFATKRSLDVSLDVALFSYLVKIEAGYRHN